MAAKKIQSEKDTLLFEIIDYQIYYHNIQKAHDSSLYYANLMINNAQKLKDTASLAKAYYRKGRIFLYLDKHEQVLRNMYKSQSLFKKLGDSSNIGRRLVELANAQDRLGDFTGSHSNATEALKFLPHTDSTFKATAHSIIAITSSKLTDYNASIKENSEALKYITTRRDSLIIINNIAINYKRIGDYKKSNELLSPAIKRTEKSSKIHHLLADNFYYNQFLDSGKNVARDLEKIAKMREDLDDIEGLINSYYHLSSIYQETNPGISKKFAEKYLATARKFGNPTAELEALKLLIILEEGERRSKYASAYFKINDSINLARTKIKNVFAKIKYDEEQKLKEIDQLQAESVKQQLESEKLKNQTIILSLGGMLILVSGGFGFYYLRQRHKREKILEAHRTETRISKKIHDELANDVYNVMSGIQDIAPNDTMDKLENIYKRTRNISRENSSIPMGVNYLPHLVSTLSSSISENTRLILRGEETINWNDISPEKKIILYRVLQEMMINMNKHSQASLVAIIFSEEKNLLKIQYSDNGIGVSNENLRSGNGIQNMENRIFSIKGKLNFETEQDKGLKILVQIPI
ncbi:ATP-binding protein [Gramella sp. MT6]|uniref:sensor histidine kinase n=1 Tax=Gramella sp. MT6 TaxID=2705471 RepID=UPI001C5FD142|nr:ATP-binding protein [Gramella sp. MT6]QYA25587.1 ATP-binding protein [Gramella sp. MT6]